MSEQNRRIVSDYYRSLWSPSCRETIASHLADTYVEHQYTANFSRNGLCAYITRRLDDHPRHRVIIHHILSQGDLVFLFVEEKLGNDVDYARGELFRLQDGKIAEHWSAHVQDEKRRKNANGTFDGPQVDRGKDYAARFGANFEALDRRGFDGQELQTFAQSRTRDYRQHSPKGADGRDGLVDILAKAKAAGIRVTMSPKRTLADGDFIMSHRLYNSDPVHPLMNRINTFDMFRLDEQGRAVEHWDAMEDVPSAGLLDKMY